MPRQPYYRGHINGDNKYKLSLYESGGTFNRSKARIYRSYVKAYLANILFRGEIEKTI